MRNSLFPSGEVPGAFSVLSYAICSCYFFIPLCATAISDVPAPSPIFLRFFVQGGCVRLLFFPGTMYTPHRFFHPLDEQISPNPPFSFLSFRESSSSLLTVGNSLASVLIHAFADRSAVRLCETALVLACRMLASSFPAHR